LFFCLVVVAISLYAELRVCLLGLFSCSGAVISIAGLFLNIKHSLHFHLRLSKSRLYNILAGAAIWGSDSVTPEQEKWVDNILSDEMFGVAFMIIGTLIWAYGSYLIPHASVTCVQTGAQ
jgi:hypothetical protein